MDKLTREDGASPDMVADNIDRLREVFPEVFADGHVDFDALKQTLGEYVDDREERYSFTWHGKSRARQIAQMRSSGTLRPCPDESVNWDTTKNIFIKGDNLEVLKLLQKSYHRKVKMIYIDPPYNTGKEFIYPDKWQDNLDTYLRYTGQVDDEGFKLSANSETSGRYHTNWLNMMYPRLKLARNLLCDDGVMFMTLDDHEVANGRKLMDEVFGEENFVAIIAWKRKTSPANDAKWFSVDHDYVLVYARSKDTWRPQRLPRTKEQERFYTNPDADGRGPWNSATYTCNKTNIERPNLYYAIKNPNTGIDCWPRKVAVWKHSAAKTATLQADGRLYWGKDGTSEMPRVKKFLSEAGGVVCRSVWDYGEVGSTQSATTELQKILPGCTFDTPKPVRLIEKMLRLSTLPNEDDLVLDFFAGSGSTGEAVQALNLDDGGRRRYILVQLPEKTKHGEHRTVADVTRARLAAASARDAQALHAPGVLGFKAFKLSGSNIKPWDAEFATMADDLVEAIDNIKAERTEDDVLYELLLKYGLDLAILTETRTIEGRSVTVIGAGALVVCLANNIDLDVVAGIVAIKEELRPEVMRVVLKDSGFADDVVKTNAAQILRQAGIDDVKSL